MAAPLTVDELIDRLRRSKLVPVDKLEGFLAGLSSAGNPPADVPDLLARLVAAGMITRFHADRLAAGKYKGFVLGSYLILDQIGSGGMGQVYLAEHAAMRRLVALKVLPVTATETAEDGVARERFLREARVAATLDHPNIVRVFDLCHEGRLMYLVMEYVEGISFQALVARAGPLPVAAAVQYVRQVAFGLGHAHELGFVHRDVKPANLLLDRTGVVKILDLGLVRSEADAGAGLTKQLDHKGVLGTADYVAPEQAMDSSNVDPRADVYSLGATFYFLLTGRPLFPDGRTAQKLVWQQIKDPVPVARLRPDIPPGLAAVVHTMLQKKPADRLQSALEVFEALEPWAHDAVPPPDEALMPNPPTRSAAGRLGPSAPARATNATSQLLTAAMRSGSGVGGPSSAGGTPGSGSLAGGPRSGLSAAGASSGKVVKKPRVPPVPRTPTPDTGAVGVEETQRTPDPKPAPTARLKGPRKPAPVPEPDDAPDPAAPFAWRRLAVLAGLLVAAGMAFGGLLLLLLRGR